MKTNYLGIQAKRNSESISEQARLLMSQSRHKQHNRQQSMLHRAAEEVGIEV
ncbi:MAG: hypothetical protein IGR93_08740 [Hydrococcus sp. C42_A2020_068]|uniref:hypothetical protein n=1 Tax=Pleurocapsa sp. PCC 7327 TaxID=118163 RepID=UPI00029FFDBF|nr:hypothetical protein [Pleurocapsa sp. PCC 7327]AFY78802.1 hypothetical protein Ple7327_3603 [Pleurocapsa sp. PCC 7327]MBF2020174.1 hypothetical protein [Hydrococcus sp. C42_A2020_068]